MHVTLGPIHAAHLAPRRGTCGASGRQPISGVARARIAAMLEDPKLNRTTLAAALRDGWGIEALGFRFVPGYDMAAAAYEVATPEGWAFVKVRLRATDDRALRVPLALADAGVPNVMAPLRTRDGALAQPMPDPGSSMLAFAHIAGRSAMDAGMSPRGWRSFGTTLRAVHDATLPVEVTAGLPADPFALPSAAVLRDVLSLSLRGSAPVAGPSAERMVALLTEHADRIEAMLTRAAQLGADLAARSLPTVVCHGDIHAANLLVPADGDAYPVLVDWDVPLLAPRERDLLFVVGSRIARTVEPREEAWFFEGYGPVEVDADALRFFRYERLVEDLGEFGRSVLADPALPESSRAPQVRLAASAFGPDGIDAVEHVEIHR